MKITRIASRIKDRYKLLYRRAWEVAGQKSVRRQDEKNDVFTHS